MENTKTFLGTVDLKEFKSALKKVQGFCDKDHRTEQLNGATLKFLEDKINVYGCNGKALKIIGVPYLVNTEGVTELTLSNKVIKEIYSMKEIGTCKLYKSGNEFAIESQENITNFLCGEGILDFESLLASELEVMYELNTKEVLDKLKEHKKKYKAKNSNNEAVFQLFTDDFLSYNLGFNSKIFNPAFLAHENKEFFNLNILKANPKFNRVVSLRIKMFIDFLENIDTKTFTISVWSKDAEYKNTTSEQQVFTFAYLDEVPKKDKNICLIMSFPGLIEEK